jgi:biotin carboxyl carrier protein
MAKTAKARPSSGKNATPVGHEPENNDRKTRLKSLVINGTRYRTKLNAKFEKRKQWEAHDPRIILSTIPGTIVKIFIKEGQEVKEGDQMLILEAMKMRNKILFSTGGRIKSIKVSEGEKIPKDYLMVELE